MAGFETTFYFAMQLKRIEDIKLHLITNFNGVQLVALYFENEKEERKIKKVFFVRTSKIVKELNSEIKVFNKHLKNYFKHLNAQEIVLIDLNEIEKVIYEHKEVTSLGRKYTILKLNNCFIKTDNSIRNFISSFNNLHSPFGGKDCTFNVDKPAFKIIKEAFEIYSIGHFETAVLLMGKCLEYTLTKYLKKKIREKKIHYTLKALKDWTFHDKIKILEKEKLISKGDFSKMMSIKWDRNYSAHPSRAEEIKKLRDDSDAIIKLSFNKIVEFHKKMK